MTAPDAVGDDGAVVELELHGFTHGGSAVGRLPDGTACFVDYAIPGERVRVRVVDRRRRWARAALVEVLDASPDRVAPPCPLFGPGRCGGCRLQHIAPRRQAALLATVIDDQLRRIGHLDAGPVDVVRPHGGDGLGYRQRARFAVDRDGHLAFRRAGSHDLIAVDDCPLLVPRARAVLGTIAAGWRGAREVQLQVGSDGGAALAVTPGRGEVAVPGGVPAVIAPRRDAGRRGDRGRGGRGRQWRGDGGRGRQEADGRGAHRHDGDQPGTGRRDRPKVHYTVAGRTYAVDPASFFQASVTAAEHLVTLVRRMTLAGPDDHVLELYAGVGLLTAALAADGARVTAVEASTTACADARVNTAGLGVTVVQGTVRAGMPLSGAVDAVVLDPPRSGTDAQVLAWIAELAPARVTYVSCDPATFARDARTLTDHGYRLGEVVGVDQFTHSAHVELVAGFTRTHA